MKFTKPQLKALRSALHYAIQWEDSFLDAIRQPHNDKMVPMKGQEEAWRHTTRNLLKFRAMMRKIDDHFRSLRAKEQKPLDLSGP